MSDVTPNPLPPFPGQHDLRPIPDPTVLTTQQLLREIATSREIVEKQVLGLVDVLGTRVASLEKVADYMGRRLDERPAEIRLEVERLEATQEMKFNHILARFSERDAVAERRWEDSKFAVTAAFAAMKETVSTQNSGGAETMRKIEAGFTKQIDQIVVLIGANQKTQDDKTDLQRERLQAIEVRLQAMESAKKGGGEVWALLGTIAGIVIGGAGAAAAFYRH